jgi:hypothetical protein
MYKILKEITVYLRHYKQKIFLDEEYLDEVGHFHYNNEETTNYKSLKSRAHILGMYSFPLRVNPPPPPPTTNKSPLARLFSTIIRLGNLLDFKS